MNNGLRKWMIGILTSIMLAWAAWVSAAVVDAKANAAVLDRMSRQLDRIESRLDAISR